MKRIKTTKKTMELCVTIKILLILISSLPFYSASHCVDVKFHRVTSSAISTQTLLKRLLRIDSNEYLV
jgi:hypothetical protein